jgi:hypothetical protein
MAAYKLAKIVGGRSHYAEVTVTAEFGCGRSVQVSPSVFAWLKDVYGPHAWEWSVCDAYRAAAVSGATFALQHIAGRDDIPEARVVIDRIHAAPADTSPDDVVYATVLAVWKALGVDGSTQPVLPGKQAEQSAAPSRPCE